MRRRHVITAFVPLVSGGTTTALSAQYGSSVEFGRNSEWTHDYHDDEGETIDHADGTVFSGSKDGTIIAVKDTNAELLWQKNVHERLPKSLVTTEFLRDIYATEDAVYSAGRNGEVVALDPQDGSKLWKHNHHTDEVWEVDYHREIIYSGSRDSKVVAADASTGDLVWSHNAHYIDGNPSNEMIRTIYCAGERVYTSGFDGRIIASDITTGEIIWKYDFGYPIKSVYKLNRIVYFSPWSENVNIDVISINEDNFEKVRSHSYHNQDAEGYRGSYTGVEEIHGTDTTIYTAGDDGKVVAAESANLEFLGEHTSHNKSVRSISSDEKFIYSIGRDGLVIKKNIENM